MAAILSVLWHVDCQAGQQLEEKVRRMVEDVRCRIRRAVHLERLAREKSEESFLQ